MILCRYDDGCIPANIKDSDGYSYLLWIDGLGQVASYPEFYSFRDFYRDVQSGFLASLRRTTQISWSLIVHGG